MSEVTLPIGPIMKQVKIDVRFTGARLASIRIQLAALIFRFAAWVAGTDIKIGVDGPEPAARRTAFDREGVPIRMSVGDRDYDHSIGLRVEVSLDGVVQDKVIGFDCEEGWVERCKLRDGRMYAEGDEVAKETVFGEVTVRLKDA